MAQNFIINIINPQNSRFSILMSKNTCYLLKVIIIIILKVCIIFVVGYYVLRKKNTVVTYGNLPFSLNGIGGCNPLYCSDGSCFKAYLPGSSLNPWKKLTPMVMLFLHGASAGVDNYQDMILNIQDEYESKYNIALAVIAPNSFLYGFQVISATTFTRATIRTIARFKQYHPEKYWDHWKLSEQPWCIMGHSSGGNNAMYLCCNDVDDTDNLTRNYYNELQSVIGASDNFLKGVVVLDPVFFKNGGADLFQKYEWMVENVVIYNTLKNCASGFPFPKQTLLPSKIANNIINNKNYTPTRLRVVNINLNYMKEPGSLSKSKWEWGWHCGWERTPETLTASACEIVSQVLPGLTCPKYPPGPAYEFTGTPVPVLPKAFQESGVMWCAKDVVVKEVSPKYQIIVTIDTLMPFLSYMSGKNPNGWNEGMQNLSGDIEPSMPIMEQGAWTAFEEKDHALQLPGKFGKKFIFNTKSAVYIKYYGQ